MPVEKVKRRDSGTMKRTEESVGCKRGECLCLCSQAAWILRKHGASPVNTSATEYQETKPATGTAGPHWPRPSG